MFDPQGLRKRYKRLTGWDAPWVNYWTITTGEHVSAHEREDEKKEEKRMEKENDLALLTSGVVCEEELQDRPVSPAPSISSTASSSSLPLPLSPPTSPPMRSVSMTPEPTPKHKRRSKHHFITLPLGLGKTLGKAEKWVRVPIAGAEDEVAAHTGLFMKHTNPDYDKFVITVGEWVSKVVNGL